MEENKENKEEMAIHASVLSLSGGMKTYENVSMVRIVSRDYNILILKDYMPTIGKVKAVYRSWGRILWRVWMISKDIMYSGRISSNF